VTLASLEGVSTTCFDRCRYGAPSSKQRPSRIFGVTSLNSLSVATIHLFSFTGKTGKAAPSPPSGPTYPWQAGKHQTACPRRGQRRPTRSASTWCSRRQSSAPAGPPLLDKRGGALASPHPLGASTSSTPCQRRSTERHLPSGRCGLPGPCLGLLRCGAPPSSFSSTTCPWWKSWGGPPTRDPVGWSMSRPPWVAAPKPWGAGPFHPRLLARGSGQPFSLAGGGRRPRRSCRPPAGQTTWWHRLLSRRRVAAPEGPPPAH
jgi:hypothetical protein